MPTISISSLQQRSKTPLLSTWNDVATIIGVPLSAMISLIAIMLMIKHHRQARRQREAPTPADIRLTQIPLQSGGILNEDNSESRGNSYVASSWKESPLARASTHSGVCCNNTQTWTPTRAATHDGKIRRACDFPHHPQRPLTRDSSRASQITLIDGDEHDNPTFIIAYPAAAHINLSS